MISDVSTGYRSLQMPAIAGKLRLLLGPGPELRCHLTAIDEERGACNVGGGIRGQESHRAGNLFGLSASSQWNVTEVILEDLGRVEVRGGETGADQPRTDRVDADTVRSELIGGGVQN